jgi:hypothetical protein
MPTLTGLGHGELALVAWGVQAVPGDSSRPGLGRPANCHGASHE